MEGDGTRFVYGLCVDDDPENPNPHAWTLTQWFDSERDAEKARSILEDMGQDDRGWLVVLIDLQHITLPVLSPFE